jgi:hypothetical protein
MSNVNENSVTLKDDTICFQQEFFPFTGLGLKENRLASRHHMYINHLDYCEISNFCV